MNFKFLLFFLFSIVFNLNLYSQDLNLFFDKTDSFLKSVVEDGKVDYLSIKNDREKLDELLALINQISPDELQGDIRKAFLINTYNILVIKEVVNHYPITSTQKINGFFEKIKHKVGSNSWTLNEIENKQIREKYNDPRIHFVLNCAALSCPPVTNFVYLPSNLDNQLETQTIKAVNDTSFVFVKNGKNYISNIFKWYKSDFTNKGTVIEFINQYRTEKLNINSRTIHYPYDWSLNTTEITLFLQGNLSNPTSNKSSFIQTYTPSSLLKKNQLEVQLYNNLYTQTAFRNDQREKVNLGKRENYFTGLINILYGVSKNRKWNVGLDINLRSVRIDDENASPLKVLSFRNNDMNNRSAISNLGPTVKFAPFKSSKISVKSSLLFPIVNDGEATERITIDSQSVSLFPWFDYDRITWWNQFFYDRNIATNWQLFVEGDLLFRFAKSASSYADNQPKDDILDTPISGFLSYFPSEKSTVYFMLQYSPRFGFNKIEGGEKVSGFNVQGDYAQTGIGFKYQVTNKLGLEILYSNFFTSANQGAGNTFNLGIRYIN